MILCNNHQFALQIKDLTGGPDQVIVLQCSQCDFEARADKIIFIINWFYDYKHCEFHWFMDLEEQPEKPQMPSRRCQHLQPGAAENFQCVLPVGHLGWHISLESVAWEP